MKPEELLAHAGFVRSLAQRLVLDENIAAEVEQRTWLAALEHPPVHAKNLRSWFGRVVRNFVITFHRSETRRRKYEQSSTDTDKTCSPDEIALRKEALQRMSQVVFNLEEPYFSTILLRFYEDLPPRELAARLGVPVETVKTRIQRALKIMREELDGHYHGDRNSWCMALAPVAGLIWLGTETAAAAGAASAAKTAAGAHAAGKATSLSSSSLLLSSKVNACLLAAILLGSAFTAHKLFLESPESSPQSVVAQSTLPMDILDQNNPVNGTDSASGSDGMPVLLDPVEDRDRVVASEYFLAGRVLDEDTREPVTAFDFKVYKQRAENDWEIDLHDTVKDEEGRFYFSLKEAGVFTITVRASSYLVQRMNDVSVPMQNKPEGLTITLNPGLTVTGTVVDDETNTPVEGALVAPASYPAQTDLISLKLLNYEESCVHTYTDAEGTFKLNGLYKGRARIAAVHSDFAEAALITEVGSGEEIELRLQKGYRLFGRALDDHGRPAEGVLIRMMGKDIPVRQPILTDADGRFRTPPVKPGRIHLEANDPPEELFEHPEFTEEHRVVDVVDRDVEVNLGFSAGDLTWRGTIFDADETPLPGGSLVVSPARSSYRESEWYRLFTTVPVSQEGSFEISKLLPGRYRVEIIHPHDGKRIYWGRFLLEGPGPVDHDLYLSRNGILAGSVMNSVTGQILEVQQGDIWAWQPDEVKIRYHEKLVGDGGFEIRNVLPGHYALRAKVDGRYSKTVYGLKVEEGGQVSGIELVLPPAGTLKLRLEGFEPEAADNRYSLAVAPRDNPGAARTLGVSRWNRNYLERTHSLETGHWKASLAFSSLGYIERTFEIAENQTTEVVIRKSELYLDEQVLDISGRLTDESGSPLEDVRITFQADSVPGITNGKVLSGTTSNEGRYTVSGLKPGRWRVEAVLHTGGIIRFPSYWLAAWARNPQTMDLKVPAGTVKGRLANIEHRDNISGENAPWWEASLVSLTDNSPVSFYRDEDRAQEFILAGIPTGEFQLFITAEGFVEYRSAPFSMKYGQTLDLGNIELTPCGLLDLEVVDETYFPVKDYSVTCDGKHRYCSSSFRDIRRYDKLPLGLVAITIQADNYLEQCIEIELIAGKLASARVVLISK